MSSRFGRKKLVLVSRPWLRQLVRMHDAEERASRRIIALYEEKAPSWSNRRGRRPTLEERWLARFEEGLGASATVLDFGAGNGYPIAATLISHGHKIVGIDSSAALIREAASNFPDSEWHVADMRAYQDDRRFDGLIAWHSFFHLPQEDQSRLLPAFGDFVRTDGMLLFTTGPKEGVTIGDWEGEPLFHASLSQDEYKSILDMTGFEIVDVKADDPETGGATVWLARRRG